MDDAALVHGRDRRGGSGEHLQAVRERERSTREDGGEVLAVEPLHGEERLAVAGRAVAHVARDAWVVDLGEQAALAGEALRDARVAARLEDQLERDRLPRLAVDGAIDDAHAALLDESFDLEPAGQHEPAREVQRLLEQGAYLPREALQRVRGRAARAGDLEGRAVRERDLDGTGVGRAPIHDRGDGGQRQLAHGRRTQEPAAREDHDARGGIAAALGRPPRTDEGRHDRDANEDRRAGRPGTVALAQRSGERGGGGDDDDGRRGGPDLEKRGRSLPYDQASLAP